MPEALGDPEVAYVIITSPEAAKVFLGGWNKAGRPEVRVACVGKATGEALQHGGVEPVFTPSKATGETLAAELPLLASTRPRVLYPSSAKAQKTIEEGLEERGFDVRRLNTYNTVPAAWNDHARAVAEAAVVAAFGSPSAVKTWASRLGPGAEGRGACAACIGETSARACVEAGWPASAVFFPDKPGVEGWAQAVRDAVAQIEEWSRLASAAG